MDSKELRMFYYQLDHQQRLLDYYFYRLRDVFTGRVTQKVL